MSTILCRSNLLRRDELHGQRWMRPLLLSSEGTEGQQGLGFVIAPIKHIPGRCLNQAHVLEMPHEHPWSAPAPNGAFLSQDKQTLGTPGGSHGAAKHSSDPLLNCRAALKSSREGW